MCENLLTICNNYKNKFFGDIQIDVDYWITIIHAKLGKEENNYHTDKYYLHSYIPIYDKLFLNFKEKSCNLLEIGVQNGGSIALFRKYFMNATIHAIDIESIPAWVSRLENVETYQEDAYSEKGLQLFKPFMFDIIIDDGPHTLESMIYIVQYYLYKLNKNGIMIIEDIPDISWINIIIEKIPSDINCKYETFDVRLEKNRYDDILLVIYIK